MKIDIRKLQLYVVRFICFHKCLPQYTTIQTPNLKFSFHARGSGCAYSVYGMLHSWLFSHVKRCLGKLRREVHIFVMHGTVIDHGEPQSAIFLEETSYAEGSADINLVTLYECECNRVSPTNQSHLS